MSPDEGERPQIPNGYEGWEFAFWELSTNRKTASHIFLPIPSQAIDDWIDRATDIGGREKLFRQSIRSMDAEFLAFMNRKPDDPKVSKQPLTPTLFSAMFGK